MWHLAKNPERITGHLGTLEEGGVDEGHFCIRSIIAIIIAGSSKKTRIKMSWFQPGVLCLPLWSSILFLDTLSPVRMLIHTKLCVQIFIATFLTYSNFFWPKTEITLMPLNWWLDRQLWYIHTLECYSAIRRNKILLYITTWVHLKTIMLRKRNQMLWSHIEWFFLYGILEMAKS